MQTALHLGEIRKTFLCFACKTRKVSGYVIAESDTQKFNKLCYCVAMKYMGIDFGTKRVGIALSDDGGTIAFPYEIVSQSKDLVDTLQAFVLKEGVEEIVIGESIANDGTNNALMEKILPFKEVLEQKLGLKVHFQKEFMTSHFASASADGKGKSAHDARQTKQKKSDAVDASAAALILQRYLDKKNSSH